MDYTRLTREQLVAHLEERDLGLYDRIVRGKFEGTTTDVWMVLDVKKNTAKELSKWLAQ